MKIVKTYKNGSKGTEIFGFFPGKTIAEIPINIVASQCTYGGLDGKVQYIKVGDTSHDAFLWFDNLDEVAALGEKLAYYANKGKERNEQENQ